MILFFAGFALMAQNSAVDKLFDKYSGKDGYTSILISKYMFSMFSDVNPDNKEFNDLVGKLNSIKILASDSSNTEGVNFYKEIISQVNVGSYKELMKIKQSDEDVVFYAKYDSNVISELLLIAGGGDDNAVISIKGKINLKDMAQLSKSVHIDGFEHMDKLKDVK